MQGKLGDMDSVPTVSPATCDLEQLEIFGLNFAINNEYLGLNCL